MRNLFAVRFFGVLFLVNLAILGALLANPATEPSWFLRMTFAATTSLWAFMVGLAVGMPEGGR